MDGKWLGNGLAVITFKNLKSLNLRTLLVGLTGTGSDRNPHVFESSDVEILKYEIPKFSNS